MPGFARWSAVIAAALVLILPLLPVPEFVITQMNYIGIDAMVVLGLVLLTGVCGLTSFGSLTNCSRRACCSTRIRPLRASEGTRACLLSSR